MKTRRKKTDQSEFEKQVKVEKDKLEAEQAEDILNQKTKGSYNVKITVGFGICFIYTQTPKVYESISYISWGQHIG